MILGYIRKKSRTFGTFLRKSDMALVCKKRERREGQARQGKARQVERACLAGGTEQAM